MGRENDRERGKVKERSWQRESVGEKGRERERGKK